jgi:tripeptide aminopeptidase
MYKSIEERFLRYVQIDTQSDVESATVPSTQKQRNLLDLIAAELRDMGVSDVVMTDYATVIGTIPATVTDAPTVALLAHVDTAMDFSGTGVKPIVHRNYDGTPIVLPDAPTRIIDPAAFPYLAKKVGQDVITASGTTLLGADDKAGAVIVMQVAAELIANPELQHGNVRLCFTPDEEIGRGVHADLPRDLAADVAYTLDGGSVGSVTYETFSADNAIVTLTGVSIHPGSSKDRMVSAIMLAAKLLSRLPADTMTPPTTEGYEGFIHCTTMTGNVAEMKLKFILRDFERAGLAAKGALLHKICDELQAEEPRAVINCDIRESYRNMRYWLEKDMRPIELAFEAARRAGLEPFSKPTRGGTDGSRLTEMGLLTPNLFTGMQNSHGPLEYVSVQDMAKSAETILHLLQLWTE